MPRDILIYIQNLKHLTGTRSDEELGKKLGFSKQAIANWRRRGEIPASTERKLVDAFGPEFASNSASTRVASIREDEVCNATALYVYERLLRRHPEGLTLPLRRSIGYLFPSIVAAIRSALRKEGFEGEDSLSMIEMLMGIIDWELIPEVQKLLKKLE